jgi:2,4-dienoyl-CoA reductase-like NADH-dependent reductase (Old Yellow Enzyme family)
MTDLFSPLPLAHGKTSTNRIWLAPLTNQQSHEDGTLSDAELAFLARRADGGFGLVETCAAHVTQDGKGWRGELGVHDDAMMPGLTRLAARIRAGGALASAQLFHGGLRADPLVSALPKWSASAVEGAREASDDDLARVVTAFGRAAARCADAGFDGVELHGAHGYLLSQFLSTVYNQRTDRWGGSLENRMRLAREVCRLVRASAPNLVLAVRLSPEDFAQSKGLDLDESIEVARLLAEDGMDVLHLSLWRAQRMTAKRPTQHATRLFRDALPAHVKIVVAGAIWTKDEAEEQLALGADAVALGRAAIGNADWPKKVAAGIPIARPPFSASALAGEGLSDVFVGYMRHWKGFVEDQASA